MERFLTREGFSVVTAAGGLEALARARELGPAAVTLDIMMPDLDGWTVLAALKGDPALADIPVVVVTILDEKSRGFSLGAVEYMVKPIDRERLLDLLRTVCGRPAGRVLVIEDDEATRAVMHQILSRDGWTIDEADNGRVGLERLAAAAPDVIVLDLMMPEMDGFEFLAELRSRPDGRDISGARRHRQGPYRRRSPPSQWRRRTRHPETGVRSRRTPARAPSCSRDLRRAPTARR